MTPRWTGKVVGGLFGALVGFGPVGAVLGVLLGHQFDKSQEQEALPGRAGAALGARFFTSTFEVMGHLAKADGRVSEREIAAARGVMRELRLDPANVQIAIACFRRGKEPGFDLAQAIRALRGSCGDRPDLLRIFFEIQLRAALAGTDLQAPTRAHVMNLATMLGISAFEFAYIETALRTRRAQGAHRPGSAKPAPAGLSIEDAYAVLEVQGTVDDGEITKAYRRQLSRHHPDKLKANGLPESMLEHAKQRTQQIIEAYELIRARRGIK